MKQKWAVHKSHSYYEYVNIWLNGYNTMNNNDLFQYLTFWTIILV